MTSLKQKTLAARKLAVGWRWRIAWSIGTPIPSDYDEELRNTIKRVRRFTMTSAPRIAALIDSVEYLNRSEIEGDVVECGVWRGGSVMAAALTLQRLGDTSRGVYLFDTFSGMPEPGTSDHSSPYDGYSIHNRWRRTAKAGREWVGVPETTVRANVESTGYPKERIHCVAGMVEDTIPRYAPHQIALLRLDTDWHSSTKHELDHLFPRLVPGGVLIIDDYGHYEGARKAVDEYLRETAKPLLLVRVDYTGRIAVKQEAARSSTS